MDTHSKIMGTSFVPNGQELLAKLKEGQELELIREPDNHIDKWAIQTHANGERIGYLAAHVVRELAPRIDEGDKFYCYVSQVTGGTEGKQYGCNIRLTDFDVNNGTNTDVPEAPGDTYDDNILEI